MSIWIGGSDNSDGTALQSIPYIPLQLSNKGFFEGNKQNNSISSVKFLKHRNTNVIHEIFKVYQQNSNLTSLEFDRCNLPAEGNCVANTLRECTRLMTVTFQNCEISDQQLMPIVEGISGHKLLLKLDLSGNRIGTAGCKTLALLLEDQNSELSLELNLDNNVINNEGVEVLASSLENNHRLMNLCLHNNQFDPDVFSNVFTRLLCDKSSINSTHLSNHTLMTVFCDDRAKSSEFQYLLNLNGSSVNKNHVAIKKILKYHPNDMKPLFGWDLNDKHTLKSLPYVIAWFERAEKAVGKENLYNLDNVDQRKLAAVYQFALAMPLKMIPPWHIKQNDKMHKLETSINALMSENGELRQKNEQLMLELKELRRKRAWAD